ncbi:TPA: hypothetical protein ENS27_02140 [bacterium]|nr:hypothetical protein [bacterium]
MKIKIFVVVLVLALILFTVGCNQQTNPAIGDSEVNEKTNEKTTSAQSEKSDGVIEKITDTFSSDVSKLKKEFSSLNDENQTFFTDISISKEGSDIKMDFTITPNATSKMILNIFTLGISVKTYEVTQNFENLKITYLNNKRQQLGFMTIPKKAIKDVADYAKQNNDENYMENPYIEAFWKISQRMYDESVPELIPTSMAEDMFGDIVGSDADEIAEALSKKVTHLEIECSGSDNWDADADDDGITYYLKPLSSDETIVPIEGTFETKVYEKVQTDDWGYEFEKGKLLYTRTGNLEGQERLNYFDTWNGYKIALSWDDVQSYMASSSDYGLIYTTFTDKQGNKFEAKTGENSFSGCQLRES